MVTGAGVKRVVLTSSLAAIECGNDEGTLTEAMWSKAEVYDSEEKLSKTQWTTHYTYVKSKVEQEKAALAFAAKNNIDMRVVVPGNLCIGPIASKAINGTMTRIKDIMSGKNTLRGAADLAIVHVQDVVDVHCKCMTENAAKGRYIVAPDMAKIKDVFAALKEMYPQLPVADMGAEMDIASGVLGAARKIDSRAATEFGLQFKPYRQALKDSIDSMIAANMITGSTGESPQKKASMTPSTQLYAITGANGFIACNLIKTLVANGHSVRGTVRDIAKHGAHLISLGATVTEVKNLTDEGPLAKVFAGVDGVFHMAAVHPGTASLTPLRAEQASSPLLWR